MQVFEVDQANPDLQVVDRIVELLKSGGVIAFPTDTFYGLGADIYNDLAVKRVFDIKGRGYNKPILILISDKNEIMPFVSRENFSKDAGRLIERFWPGPLTLVFKASDVVPKVLTGGTGKIGIRLPDHPFCQRLVERMGRPITATSANLSGGPDLDDPSEVKKSIGDRIDALVDGGSTPGGFPSTVVDVTGVEPLILREGAIPALRIKEALS